MHSAEHCAQPACETLKFRARIWNLLLRSRAVRLGYVSSYMCFRAPILHAARCCAISPTTFLYLSLSPSRFIDYIRFSTCCAAAIMFFYVLACACA